MKNPGKRPNRKEMPIIGYVKVPIRAWSLSVKDKEWSSGGAFWWGVDSPVDVSDAEYNGMFGGTMGGGMGYSLKKDKDNFYGEVYPEDFYEELIKALATVSPEKVEEIIKEYGNPGIPDICPYAKVNKIKADKMKKEKAELLAKSIKDKIPAEPKSDDNIITINQYGRKNRILIIEDGGWDLKQYFEDQDYFYLGESYNKNIFPEEKQIEINPQWGTNVKFQELDRQNKTIYISDNERKNWNVNLEIISYIGLSPGAQHYYANLSFDMPDLREEGRNDGYTTSAFDAPSGFSHQKIDLTRPLTKKEIKEFPDRYKNYKAGARMNLWYSEEKIKEKAQEVFSKIFTNPRWKLIIDDEY